MSRFPNLSSEFYTQVRKKLAKMLPKAGFLVLGSNSRYLANADAYYVYRQNSDFLYLTGIYSPDCILVIAKDPKGRTHEQLYIPEVTQLQMIWDGEPLTKKLASEVSGVRTVHLLKDLEQNLIKRYKNYTEGYFAVQGTVGLDSQKALKRRLRKLLPRAVQKSLLPLIHAQRVRKQPEEIGLIKKAIQITGNGFSEALPLVKSGNWEFQVESQLLHTFTNRRSRGFAFEPIIGAGLNSCTLHYIENKNKFKVGQAVLMDIGAEYGGYNADVTRVVPVTQFNKKQANIFDAVDRVVDRSIPFFKPGTTLLEINKKVASLVEEELLQLGLLKMSEVKKQDKKNPAYRKYYMHSSSHFLGIDVHDVGARDIPLEEGMVLTLEPGIYAREYNTGIRLEEDILITKKGNRVLTKSIPRRWEDLVSS